MEQGICGNPAIDRVVVNTMGERIDIDMHTLRLLPGVYGQMFAEERAHMLRRDPDGSVYVACDPMLFRHLVNATMFDAWDTASLPLTISRGVWERFLSFSGVLESSEQQKPNQQQEQHAEGLYPNKRARPNETVPEVFAQVHDLERALIVDMAVPHQHAYVQNEDGTAVVIGSAEDYEVVAKLPELTIPQRINGALLRAAVRNYFLDSDAFVKEWSNRPGIENFVVHVLEGQRIRFHVCEQMSIAWSCPKVYDIELVDWLAKSLSYNFSIYFVNLGCVTISRAYIDSRSKSKVRNYCARWPMSIVKAVGNKDEDNVLEIIFRFSQPIENGSRLLK